MKIKRLRSSMVYLLVLTMVAGVSLVQCTSDNPKQSEEKKIQEIVSKMTLEQKAQLVIGTGMFFDFPDSVQAKMPPGFNGKFDSNDTAYVAMVKK